VLKLYNSEMEHPVLCLCPKIQSDSIYINRSGYAVCILQQIINSHINGMLYSDFVGVWRRVVCKLSL
jgi:hypothetical protein